MVRIFELKSRIKCFIFFLTQMVYASEKIILFQGNYPVLWISLLTLPELFLCKDQFLHANCAACQAVQAKHYECLVNCQVTGKGKSLKLNEEVISSILPLNQSGGKLHYVTTSTRWRFLPFDLIIIQNLGHLC